MQAINFNAQHGQAELPQLPYLMSYQFVGGPMSFSETPGSISFSDVEPGSVNGVGRLVNIPIGTGVPSQWIKDSFARNYSSKDGRILTPVWLTMPDSSVPSFLDHALYSQMIFPQASLNFRVLETRSQNHLAQAGQLRVAGLVPQPSARAANVSREFQLTLYDSRVVNIVRGGEYDSILLLSSEAAWSGFVPPSLWAEWNNRS